MQDRARALSRGLVEHKGRWITPQELELIEKTDAEWQKQLTPDQFQVARAKGTERPFCGNLLDNKKEGFYGCVVCGLPLFSSDHKFDSGTGWPSYYQPFDKAHVTEKSDTSHGMVRQRARLPTMPVRISSGSSSTRAPVGTKW